MALQFADSIVYGLGTFSILLGLGSFAFGITVLVRSSRRRRGSRRAR